MIFGKSTRHSTQNSMLCKTFSIYLTFVKINKWSFVASKMLVDDYDYAKTSLMTTLCLWTTLEWQLKMKKCKYPWISRDGYWRCSSVIIISPLAWNTLQHTSKWFEHLAQLSVLCIGVPWLCRQGGVWTSRWLWNWTQDLGRFSQ